MKIQEADTLLNAIARNAINEPEGSAFIQDGEVITWSNYNRVSSNLSQFFIELDIPRGEKIAVLLPDSIDVHIVFVACEMAGLIAVGISSRAGEKEIAHLIKVTSPAVLLSYEEHRGISTEQIYLNLKADNKYLKWHICLSSPIFGGAINILANGKSFTSKNFPTNFSSRDRKGISKDEIFLINSTSGTTGLPKCVAQNQRRWISFCKYAMDSAPLSKEDIFFCAVPPALGFGLWSGHFLPALLGATTILMRKFDARSAISLIESYRISVISAVSTQFIMMLNESNFEECDLRSLRILFTGGEPVPYERANRFEAISGAKVLQFYGSNEAGAVSYTSTRDSKEKRLKTAGRIIKDMNVRLINDKDEDVTKSGLGQPICKGPLTSLGYYNNESANRELFTKDGFTKLGDIVEIDSEGYLKVVGRVGDFIIRGGKNISAAAVEDSVMLHPLIKNVAAIALPDPIFGERVCAYVTLREGKTLNVAELAEFLAKKGISPEYFPEKIIVLNRMPITSGKIAKKLLREDLRQRLLNLHTD